MEFRWPNIEYWLGSFVVLQGIRTCIAKKPYFCDFSGGPDALSPPPPPLDPRMDQPVHVYSLISAFVIGSLQMFYLNSSGVKTKVDTLCTHGLHLISAHHVHLCVNLSSDFTVYILTGKRNDTIQFGQARHVVHKHELHELTMTRTLSKASGLFYFFRLLFIRHVG